MIVMCKIKLFHTASQCRQDGNAFKHKCLTSKKEIQKIMRHDIVSPLITAAYSQFSIVP